MLFTKRLSMLSVNLFSWFSKTSHWKNKSNVDGRELLISAANVKLTLMMKIDATKSSLYFNNKSPLIIGDKPEALMQ